MEKIWLGNMVRIGSKTPRYMYSESDSIIEFRTMKNKNELGWLDKKTNVIYFNDDYKNYFKNVKKQIVKDFNPVEIADYFTINGII